VRCPESLEPEFQGWSPRKRVEAWNIGWDPQFRRRRADRKICSDARWDRESWSNKDQSRTTKVGKRRVAEIEDADGRAHGGNASCWRRARIRWRTTAWLRKPAGMHPDPVQKAGRKVLGTSAAQVVDLWNTRQVEHGWRLHRFLLWARTGESRQVHRSGSVKGGRKSYLHAGRRPKRRPEDSASCRDQHCGRKTPRWCASTIEKRSESRPGCRSCRRKPVADCNRSGNNDCEEPGVPARERASSNPKRVSCSVRLRKRSVVHGNRIRDPARGASQSGFCGCQSDRSHAGEPGMRSAIDDVGSARTESGLARNQHSGTEPYSKPFMVEPFGASRVRKA